MNENDVESKKKSIKALAKARNNFLGHEIQWLKSHIALNYGFMFLYFALTIAVVNYFPLAFSLFHFVIFYTSIIKYKKLKENSKYYKPIDDLLIILENTTRDETIYDKNAVYKLFAKKLEEHGLTHLIGNKRSISETYKLLKILYESIKEYYSDDEEQMALFKEWEEICSTPE